VGPVQARHFPQEQLRRPRLDELSVASTEDRVGRRAAHLDKNVRAVAGRHEGSDRIIDAVMKVQWVPRDRQNRPAQRCGVGRRELRQNVLQ
jgi:hypothetical protein